MPQSDATSEVVRHSPQEQVMGILMGLIQGRSLIAAAELGIADVLANGPLSANAIASQTHADADNVFRLLRALETIGVFKQVSPRIFENTPLSVCLRKNVPGSLWALVQINAPGWGHWEGFAEMLPTVQTGRTTLFERQGCDLWEQFRRNPGKWAVFNEAMRSVTFPTTPTITAAYNWARYPVIADIGGGIGTQLVDILNANPGCRGVLFDQADVVASAIPHDRVECVSGNFFEKISVDADAYIFRNIIHDWNDAMATSILKMLRKATKPTSRIMLIEWVIPENSDFHFGKWTDMTMMTCVSGRERTKSDFETLFKESGFVLEEIVPTASTFSIVVGRPAT